jgi:hypothetical protein
MCFSIGDSETSNDLGNGIQMEGHVYVAEVQVTHLLHKQEGIESCEFPDAQQSYQDPASRQRED